MLGDGSKEKGAGPCRRPGLWKRIGLRGGVARGALVLAVAATAAFLGLQCGDEGPGTDHLVTLVITPENATVALSSSEQFTATVDGVAATVTWYVNGIEGGTPADGMITTGGLFIAPAQLPAQDRITVAAKVVGDSTLQHDVAVDLVEQPGEAVVVVYPGTASVVATGSLTFVAAVVGCGSDSVTWSLARITRGFYNTGSITAGTYEGPVAADQDFALLIEATSFGCPGKIGIARLTVNAPPRSFDVEMEAFTQSYNVPGSEEIEADYCGGASGGQAVLGLDREGEYIDVPVGVPASGTYTVTLRYQAAAEGDTIASTVSMIDCGTPVPETGFLSTHGAGIG
jgi:hypothetical protein